jgi:hypothetical protein
MVERLGGGCASSSDQSLDKLILPEILKPIGRQSRIADRGHDRAVAEIGLDGTSVVAGVASLNPQACRSMWE